MRKYAVVVSSLVLTLLAAACSGDDGTAPTASPSSAPPPTGVATLTPLATFIPRPSPTPEPAASSTPALLPTETPSDGEARVVHRGVTTRRAVALTFDAGSDDGNTAEILQILREQGIRATFSLTGVWSERYRDLLLAIAADGHQIINHTYDHKSFTGASTFEPPLTSEERALELSRTEVTVYRYTSQSTKPYFRPPYGDYDDSVLIDAAANGHDTIVMWTVDTLGWIGATADDIVARSIAAVEPGAIYVMHVGSASQDAAALPRIIEALEADGYGFETVAEILQD